MPWDVLRADPLKFWQMCLKPKMRVTLRQRLQKEFGIEDPWVYIYEDRFFFFKKNL